MIQSLASTTLTKENEMQNITSKSNTSSSQYPKHGLLRRLRGAEAKDHISTKHG
jgi:hypothetical protein